MLTSVRRRPGAGRVRAGGRRVGRPAVGRPQEQRPAEAADRPQFQLRPPRHDRAGPLGHRGGLPRIAPKDPAVVAAVIDALDDSNDLTTPLVIEALVKIGQPAINPLVGRLANRDARVRLHAIEALAAMAPSVREALEALRAAAAKDADDEVRAEAAAALKKIAAGGARADPRSGDDFRRGRE